jgi:hypothetical protein
MCTEHSTCGAITTIKEPEKMPKKKKKKICALYEA